MDMSLVLSAVMMQAANTQQQIGTAALKQNLDSQNSVLQLLQPTATPAANNAPGVGGQLDITA